MGDGILEGVDLFGNPVRPGIGQRGRPPYEATEKDRNKIKLLLALGWSNSRVANAIDISLATLKRYFRAELAKRDAMRDRLEARRLEIAMDQANAGNVAALKELGRMIEKSDLMGAAARMQRVQEEADAAPKLGKKEQAAQEARALADGDASDWGDDLRFPGLGLTDNGRRN